MLGRLVHLSGLSGDILMHNTELFIRHFSVLSGDVLGYNGEVVQCIVTLMYLYVQSETFLCVKRTAIYILDVELQIFMVYMVLVCRYKHIYGTSY